MFAHTNAARAAPSRKTPPPASVFKNRRNGVSRGDHGVRPALSGGCGSAKCALRPSAPVLSCSSVRSGATTQHATAYSVISAGGASLGLRAPERAVRIEASSG